ncbi:GntR family transcriptional regulator [Aquamicrobium sp. LC103]|uniref:GntR family transcriptional regulator n=1 Tax=Aquamicrobium sp. LC103 TaxID=1120658 RepID=UPI00069B312F|nr:GntR family transcriptional regulator [Aquamicrobium sp. LC103]TKT75889.1 GntR family transcriptional regulator [Aquamicrobium sp. LC103]
MLDNEAYSSPTPAAGKGQSAERALRSAIVHCVLAPGERLSEVALAREFALGRGAVRAALARLQASGFVSSSARSGWSVTPVSAGEIRELSAARRHLEPMLCSAVLDEHDRARLRGLAEMHVALTQREELGGNVLPTIRRCERDMLDTLAARLSMPVVAGWLTDLWDRSIRLVNFFEGNGPARLTPANRSRLVEALLDGRKSDALDHLSAANTVLETFLLDRFLESEAIVGSRTARRRSVRKDVARRSPDLDEATNGMRTHDDTKN